MRIIFMGTPEFAVPSLEILVKNNYDIVGVVTATDKMGGRGKKTLIQSAVKKYALANDLNILQPPNLKDPDFVDTLLSLSADLQVVVAFRMLPKVIWDMPPLGSMNLHGSLLPAFRGAAPIHWSVINGEQMTGVTTFMLKHAIDTGDILLQAQTPIGPNDTTGDIYERLKSLGAELVLRSVQQIEKGTIRTTAQDPSRISYAPKIFHKDCKLDFNLSASQVHNKIRGLNPFPLAWTIFNGVEVKIISSRLRKRKTHWPPGTLVVNIDKGLSIAAAGGLVDILELKIAGKKKMSGVDFINGHGQRSKLKRQ